LENARFDNSFPVDLYGKKWKITTLAFLAFLLYNMTGYDG